MRKGEPYYKDILLRSLQGEEWKQIPGLNYYFASSLGRIKCHIDTDKIKYDIICSQRVTDQGYLRVTLGREGPKKAHSAHRLVAAAFIPNPHQKSQVNHLNGIKCDNRRGNLAWSTAHENITHAYKIGLKTKVFGQAVSVSILTNEQALKIFNSTERTGVLSKRFKVSGNTITAIRNGSTWSKVTGKRKILTPHPYIRSKIDAELVMNIFNAIGTHASIGRKFTVSACKVGKIKSGLCFSHITGKKYEKIRSNVVRF